MGWRCGGGRPRRGRPVIDDSIDSLCQKLAAATSRPRNPNAAQYKWGFQTICPSRGMGISTSICISRIDTIRHIFREANGPADKIAILHHQLPVDEIKHHTEFLTHVLSDAIGCGLTCG